MGVEGLLEHAAKYRPGFPEAIRGASPEKIAALERVAGLPLPPSYRAFLATMGEDHGGLELVGPCLTDIDAVLEYYALVVASGEAVVPDDCIVFAYPDTGFAEDVFLQLIPGNEPRIVLGNGHEIERTFAESLPKLLYRSVFQEFAMPGRKHVATFRTAYRQVAIEAIREAFTALHLTVLWFSDGAVQCAEAGGIAAFFSRFDDAVRVAADAADGIERVRASLAARLLLR